MNEEYQDLNFIALGVNIDTIRNKEDIKEMEAFKKEKGINKITLYDLNLEVTNKYSVKSIPITYLLDTRGVIQKIWIGFNIQMADEYRTEIEKLLKDIN